MPGLWLPLRRHRGGQARGKNHRGREWLLRDRLHEPGKPAALVKGQPVEAAEAVELAARLLMKAQAPIILGLGRSTNETVAAALELADRIGAVVEPGNSRSSAPRVLAFQRAGRVSATLGEVNALPSLK